MPWNKSDYPVSMKNLKPRIRHKAIDIANALLDEGYDEGRAIAIATAKAEEWDENHPDHTASGSDSSSRTSSKNLTSLLLQNLLLGIGATPNLSPHPRAITTFMLYRPNRAGPLNKKAHPITIPPTIPKWRLLMPLKHGAPNIIFEPLFIIRMDKLLVLLNPNVHLSH